MPLTADSSVDGAAPPPAARRAQAERECSQRLKVLADPTRLAIVRCLRKGALHVQEINQRLGLEQSLLSHHLKVLRDAGMVSAHRDGKAVLYTLHDRVRLDEAEGIDLGCCRLSFPDGASPRG